MKAINIIKDGQVETIPYSEFDPKTMLAHNGIVFDQPEPAKPVIEDEKPVMPEPVIETVKAAVKPKKAAKPKKKV